MIEVASAKSLEAPARDLNELCERLSRYIGDTVSVEPALQQGHSRRRVGKLGELEYIGYPKSDAEFSYTLVSAAAPQYRGSIRSVYKVLVDNQWKLIHDGSVVK